MGGNGENLWGDARWMEQYELLIAWGEDLQGGCGHTCEVPHGAVYAGMKLGNWLQNQVRNRLPPREKVTLSEDKSNRYSVYWDT